MNRRAIRRSHTQGGMTFLELVISCAILMVLAGAAIPIARFSVIRQKEYLLRYDLRTMREAIDRYKDFADKGQIRIDANNGGYPADLKTLVKGVPLVSLSSGSGTKKIHFLRSIPVDPMTGQADWGLRCVSDDSDSTNWCGKNVFDIYSKSQGTALDGTKYSDW
jgi:general secretion pathway protein G